MKTEDIGKEKLIAFGLLPPILILILSTQSTGVFLGRFLGSALNALIVFWVLQKLFNREEPKVDFEHINLFQLCLVVLAYTTTVLGSILLSIGVLVIGYFLHLKTRSFKNLLVFIYVLTVIYLVL